MSGGSPSLRRSRPMVTATVLLNGSAFASHTCSRSSSALTVAPSAMSRRSSTPNSLRVKATGRPPRVSRGGQHEDTAASSFPDQSPTNPVTMHSRKIPVEDDDVVVDHGRALEGGRARIAQALADAFRQRSVVLHDQHSHTAIVHPIG